jgi:hypothetical protein
MVNCYFNAIIGEGSYCYSEEEVDNNSTTIAS